MKRLSLIVALTLAALAVQAQLLWKVSGNGLGRPSYIFGTYHFAPSSVMEQIPGMEQALSGCDIVVGEVDKESMMSQDGQLQMAQAMVAPPDSSLVELFSPEDYGIIEGVFNKYFGTMGVTLAQMNDLKPAAISLQMQSMQAVKYFPNFNPNDLIDMAVQTCANEMGRPSLGLETIQEQVDLLLNTPLTDQAQDLLETCKRDKFFKEQSVALADAYMAMDLNRIMEIMTDAAMGGDDEAAMEALIYSRNRGWADKLRYIMPERACLVCVGAGHLPGDRGLLQLLRDAGYTVEAMR